MDKPEPVAVTATSGELKVEGAVPTPWLTFSWAPHCYEFARAEARDGASRPLDWHPRAREIIFACCCAEAFLFEWVRDEVLQRRFDAVDQYFPPRTPGRRQPGLREKWKKIPKQLLADGRIAGVPEMYDLLGSDWSTLIDYRDGLIHARSSRPESPNQRTELNPSPTVTGLTGKDPAWAVNTVTGVIRRLCAAAKTPTPPWLGP